MLPNSEHSSTAWNDGTNRDAVGEAASVNEVELSVPPREADRLGDGVDKSDVSNGAAWSLCAVTPTTVEVTGLQTGTDVELLSPTV